jgi:hypothetical protein
MAGNVASGAVPDPSADRSTDETISAVPDPGAELPSDTAPETFSEGVPETGPSAERVEE